MNVRDEYDPRDTLTEQTLRASLGDAASGLRLSVYPSCDSTNLRARAVSLEGEMRPTLLVAEEQTAGRGRLGRQFHSPKGTGIYLSLLFPLSGDLPSAVILTCAASVGVMRAIRKTTGVQTSIKWVNDLLLDGKKVCGILTEALTVGDTTHIVIGVGINLRPVAFPPALREIATHLGQDTLPRRLVVAEVTRELLKIAKDPSSDAWLDEYRAHACVLGRRVRWIEQGESREGEATGIDRDGSLLVLAENGERVRLHSGEITLRPLD